MTTKPLRRLAGIIAVIVAMTIAIAMPAGYIVEQVISARHILRFKARLGAATVSRYIYTHPTLWQYHGDRISGLLTLPAEDSVHQTVWDRDGRLVLEIGEPIGFLSLTARMPIFVHGTEVGELVIATDLRNTVLNGLFITALSWILAAAAFMAVRLLPFRVLDRTLHELNQQRTRFAAALECMIQGLCMLDQNERVAVVNRHFVEMFGLQNVGSVVGLRVQPLIDLLVVRSGLDREGCERVLLAKGVATPESAMSAIVRVTDGRVLHITRGQMHDGLWVATFDDVTSQRQADEAEADRARALAETRLLRERERAAQETSKAKSLFLATMSHEIRTPMNAVLGLTSSLLEGDLTEEQRRIVATIHESGENLLTILNDILDYSKIEAGQMKLECLPFSPRNLVQTVQDIMRPRAMEKGLAFSMQVDPKVPDAVIGDSGRIRQILLNLVSNAVKFTDTGQVTVDVRCCEVGSGTATLEWSVQDTGIGIAPDKIGSLFGEFVQADPTINRRFGGSGLGLAICKRLAQQMDGRIVVASNPGTGTTFCFRASFPTAAAPIAAGVTMADAAARFEAFIVGLGRRLRILVAEDNVTNQFVIRQMLKTFAIDLTVVADGNAAVAAASASAFDLICMDIQMPDMDGLAATRAIRAKGGRLAALPILALTGNAFQDDVQACLDAGMNAFISKPVGKVALLQTMVAELTRVQPLREIGGAQDSPDLSEPVDAGYNRETVING